MRAIHFDCFSGISGDMTVGALLDAGADFASAFSKNAGPSVATCWKISLRRSATTRSPSSLCLPRKRRKVA